jgi:hypothetical protein
MKVKKLWYQFWHKKIDIVDGDKGTDWVVPDEIVPAASSEGSFSRKNKTLPVQNQGRTNTCVGQTAKVCMQDSIDYRDGEELSAMYIYYYAQRMDEWPGEAYEGTSISGACEALRKKGNVLEKTWPNKVLTRPTGLKILDKEASRRQIKGYYSVHKQDLKFEDKIKGLLNNESLLMSFMVSPTIFGVGSDGIINSEQWEKEYTGKHGGHAVAITGRRVLNGEIHWEIQNSWGEGWGKNGFAYMPNSLMKKYMIGNIYYVVTQKEAQGEIPFEYEKKSKKTMFYVGAGIGGVLLIGWLISLLT